MDCGVSVVAVLNKGIITEFYNRYRADLKKAMSFETELRNASDKKDWVNCLALKSEFLRKTFRENETALAEWVYPYVEGKTSIDGELAEEFYTNAADMLNSNENDPLMTIEVLKMLRVFYRNIDRLDWWIKSSSLLGMAYDRMANETSSKNARKCYEEIIRYSDRYFYLEEWEVRRRILEAFFFSINGNDIESNNERVELIVLYENAKKFFNNPNVRAIDSDKFDFDNELEEMRSNMIWALILSDSEPTKEIMDYVENNLLPAGIRWSNYLTQSPACVLCFLWYKFFNGDIEINRYIELIALYYRYQDDDVDYSCKSVRSNRVYRVKTYCMQQCFRALSLPFVNLESREKYFQEMLNEYKSFYLGMPFINNNNFLDRDLCDTTKLMLRCINDARQGFDILFEVVLPRNAATMIHSIMVGKIAAEIVDCLVDDNPDLFFELVGVESERIVREKREYLKKLVVDCAHIHDIGKAYIYDVVSQQTRKLTREEFGLIRKHPEFGAKMLKGTNFGARYTEAILGHHRAFDGKSGYPEWFDNLSSDYKIIIDILTLSDCVDAATDMLGRNYEINKAWQPALADEIKGDDLCRYNQQIFYQVCKNKKANDNISFITNDGRMDVYYEIYKKYIANDHSDEMVRVVNVKIN